MSRGGDLSGLAWRIWADASRRLRRQGSASAAFVSLGRPDRRDADAWLEATASRMDRYRQDHSPAADRVAIVCVSQRPDRIDDVIANVRRQLGELAIEFALVTNAGGFDHHALTERIAAVPDATVVEMPPDASLGACLNVGLGAVTERFVAKFDDDDWYGPQYLADALRAHAYAGAGVVGKHSYYADVGTPSARYLRFPGHDFSYSGTLAGGTLVIDRDRLGGLEFEDVSIGEDRRFIAACHRRGVSTFSADRFGFVQRRDGRNTWLVPDDQFLRGCMAVDPDDVVHEVDR